MQLFAHAGHGSQTNSLFHYLFEPIHLVTLLAGIAILFGISFIFSRLSERSHEQLREQRIR